jgi:hypothetical protein
MLQAERLLGLGDRGACGEDDVSDHKHSRWLYVRQRVTYLVFGELKRYVQILCANT